MELFTNPIAYAIFISLLALLYAVYLTWQILRADTGTEKMVDISSHIREGATAYLNKQATYVGIFAIVIFFLLWFLLPDGAKIAWGFLAGAILSGFAGYVGMVVATRANVRTAAMAKHGMKEAFALAYKGGNVVGLFVVATSLLGVSLLYYIYNEPTLMIGFGFGASLISLFARVGGGIYTKAADVGADLVGKVEAGIPEDDPRNPAVIADNVGDNVGDCAGMGADLFESYAVTLIAAMILAATPSIMAVYGQNGVILPIFLGAVAIVAGIIGSFFVTLGRKKDIMGAFYKGIYMTALLGAVGFALVMYFFFPANWLALTGCGVIGLAIMVLINKIAEYYTATHYKPVRSIAKASETGAGTNLIAGLAIGKESTFLPVLLILAGMLGAYWLAGIFGIAIAAVGMLSTTGLVISMDSYGPITDNAGGIAEMSGLPEKTREVTDELDAVGNTTKAVTKAFAIGSAALAALVMFAAFTDYFPGQVFDLSNIYVLIGLFLGAVIPFLFSSMTMKSVGKAAFAIVTEVRRQFKEIKGIMTGEGKPEYGTCVAIVTQAALKEMILPGILAVVSPLLIGWVFGPKGLAGMLTGVIISGFLLAIQMTTGGAAWDNAKKHIEKGHHGGKGSDAHKAAVVGDTVGDPYKDTAGPALNSLIKVINTIALIIAPLLTSIALIK
jgi:K(+)-stimulated pyrophosphate-energized sodium pump